MSVRRHQRPHTNRMITMKEVAERAGVSITTVSHAINKTRFVSDELAKRVKQAVEELDYRPHQLAQSLRRGKTQTIAVLVSDIVNPFFPQVVRGAEDFAKEHGYSLILCNTDEDPQTESFYVSLMIDRRVDGFIIAPSMAAEESLRSLIEKDISLVVIDRPMETLSVDQVYSDNVDGAYQATKYLLGLGHKRIGLITELEGIRSFDDRKAGWRRALKEQGLSAMAELVQQAGLEIEGAAEAARYLVEGPPQATAIFATNNLMTLGVLRYLKKRNVSCPRDLSVVGFDDPEWAASFNPSITSVAQQSYEMGYKACDLLVARMQEKTSESRVVQLNCELKVRDSCAMLQSETS